MRINTTQFFPLHLNSSLKTEHTPKIPITFASCPGQTDRVFSFAKNGTMNTVLKSFDLWARVPGRHHLFFYKKADICRPYVPYVIWPCYLENHGNPCIPTHTQINYTCKFDVFGEKGTGFLHTHGTLFSLPSINV